MIEYFSGGMMINDDASVIKVMYVKKIMFRILLHVILKMENIWQVLWVFHNYL